MCPLKVTFGTNSVKKLGVELEVGVLVVWIAQKSVINLRGNDYQNAKEERDEQPLESLFYILASCAK